MTEIELCNNALSLVGQGVHIESFDDNKKEASMCKRLYEATLARCLDKYNWSFTRKDEVITAKYELTEAVSLPWQHTYTLPDDVQRILYAYSIDEDWTAETIGFDRSIKFNFRNYKGQRVLVTDAQAPFVIQYQAKTCDVELLPPTFCEGLEHILAASFAIELTKGVTGLNVSEKLNQLGYQLLAYAYSLDAQQGANSVKADDRSYPFLRARC